jgi:hypothetical protein
VLDDSQLDELLDSVKRRKYLGSPLEERELLRMADDLQRVTGGHLAAEVQEVADPEGAAR